MKYDVVIGIEIHCELKTKTKMFSSSPSVFGEKPNTCVNEIDLAHPGTLPSVNKEAVLKAIQACSALHLDIDPVLRFDRKNYFYSDLPKGYQITQQFHPIGRNGYIEIDVDGNKRKIRINRIHLEEDTAKQFHVDDETLIDFNRAGTPLIEIVSECDMTSAQEACAYISSLKETLYYLGVSDVKMEEGSMRCDVNISLKPEGSSVLGVKNEIKNLNSISNVQKSIEYEIKRQSALLDNFEKITQATARYDEATNKTVIMRLKEGNVDYKFFPEPNILPIRLDAAWIKDIIDNLPELPDAKRKRYKSEFSLNSKQIDILIDNKELGCFYELVMKSSKYPIIVWNWITSDVLAWCNKNNKAIESLCDQTKNIALIIDMVEQKEISGKQAKEIFPEVLSGENPKDIVLKKGITQVSDESLIMSYINEALDENPQSIIDYKNGKDRAVGFLVGQVMKKSKGQANPALSSELVLKELKNR
ncbi:MAG: Asp-tRNA(Asn)/Glu-tRNA(Gln) amidotransferase subunit GatB [Anaerorhabdus sp.]